MIDFLIAIIEGVILGVTFYACVRLRMRVAPIMLEKYGQNPRKITWLLSIALMVLLANLGLLLLRTSLFGFVGHDPSIATEACFAITALVTGCLLVLRHTRGSDSCATDAGSSTIKERTE